MLEVKLTGQCGHIVLNFGCLLVEL